jgi:hypothetical protein
LAITVTKRLVETPVAAYTKSDVVKEMNDRVESKIRALQKEESAKMSKLRDGNSKKKLIGGTKLAPNLASSTASARGALLREHALLILLVIQLHSVNAFLTNSTGSTTPHVDVDVLQPADVRRLGRLCIKLAVLLNDPSRKCDQGIETSTSTESSLNYDVLSSTGPSSDNVVHVQPREKRFLDGVQYASLSIFLDECIVRTFGATDPKTCENLYLELEIDPEDFPFDLITNLAMNSVVSATTLAKEDSLDFTAGQNKTLITEQTADSEHRSGWSLPTPLGISEDSAPAPEMFGATATAGSAAVASASAGPGVKCPSGPSSTSRAVSLKSRGPNKQVRAHTQSILQKLVAHKPFVLGNGPCFSCACQDQEIDRSTYSCCENCFGNGPVEHGWQ